MERENKLNVWFFPGWYPDRHDSMFGLFVRRHAEAVSLIHSVTVLYASGVSDAYNKYEITLDTSNDITEVICYYKKETGILRSLLNPARYMIAQIRLLRYCNSKFTAPDICHVHVLTRAATIPLYLSYAKHIPFVITEHWSRYLPENISKGSYKGILRKWFTKLVARKATGISAVTNNLATAMQEAGLNNENYLIIPNVADPSLFKPCTPDSHPSKNDFARLVHVSCFDERAKNIKGIIDAVSELRKERSDFRLYIIGDGEDHRMVYDYFQSLAIPEGTVEFTGLLEGEPLADMMAGADLYVMFSNYENLPCTIVESLTCGVPVISTAVGGISEFVNEENGILVNRGNTRQLVEGIRAFLDGKKTFNNQLISKKAAEIFSYKAVAKQFNNLYKSTEKA